MRSLAAVGIAAALVAACDSRAPGPSLPRNTNPPRCPGRPPVYAPTPAETERDRIHSLLAYSVALADWQEPHAERRGRNIAAVLVDPSGKPVCWARNAIERENDATAHAETRLMTSYLKSSGIRNLQGFKVFTTLEPCAMCAGMMTMTRVSAAVWGQADEGSGRVLERLALDSTEMGGYCPYPLLTLSVGAPVDVRAELERANAKSPVKGTGFLATDEARRSFEKADAQLRSLQPSYPENAETLRVALAFLRALPKEPVAAPYTALCSPSLATTFPAASPP